MNTTTVTQPAPSPSEVTAVMPPVAVDYAGRHRYGCCDSIDGWCAQCSALAQIGERVSRRGLLRLYGRQLATHGGAS